VYSLAATVKNGLVCGVIVAVIAICPRPVVSQSADVDLGGLVLSVSDSRTAQLFRIVDQVSRI
jgi:hypothetical protein